MNALHFAQTLQEAIKTTYAGRGDIVALEFGDSEVQAWETCARMLALQPGELARALAPAFGVEAAGALDAAVIAADVLALVPYRFCQKHTVLPLGWRSGALEVATFQPANAELRERLSFLAEKPIRWLLAPPSAIEDAVLAAYSREAVRFLLPGAGHERVDATLDDNAVVRLARQLMSTAVQARASDLHIQPYLGATVARIRVDGVLRRLAVLPDAVATALVRHIKVRGGMDSTSTLTPQDGRMSLLVDGGDFSLRLSSLPVSGGERLVVRFLPQNRTHLLATAGFSLAALQTLRRAIARPAGLVVFTGPTGCGKTSTLYAMLSEVNRSGINIITVENPVEYRVPGISQVEVNEKANRSFGTALRAILRQDPDVILVGEIRDHETAEIATQAALTGHLVLTTLHTNDALTAVPRLLDLGVPPSILADALVMVASQRLCRRLCVHCRVAASDPLAPQEQAFVQVTRNRPAYRAVGCAQCDFTGYHGRLPIVDIIEMNRSLRDAVALGECRLSSLAALRDGGLKSLAASGSLRVISGDTTVDELTAAVGPGFWQELAEHYGGFFPSEALESLPVAYTAGTGVLLISADDILGTRLRQALSDDGFRLVQAATAEAAGDALRNDADIAFVIGDLPDGSMLSSATQALQHNREHIAWARLPSMVLIPESLAGQEDALRDSGVMASFMARSERPERLREQIHRARAR